MKGKAADRKERIGTAEWGKCGREGGGDGDRKENGPSASPVTKIWISHMYYCTSHSLALSGMM